jgi:glycosyltransferase involved in cell wall biosynthesis
VKITVVTVAFNAEATIADTLRSVAAQRGPEVEHLLIDGGSTDRTLAIAGDFARPALRVISEPDRGIYDAMNKGLREAAGAAIGFLNADDFFCRSDALALIAAALGDAGIDAAAGSVAIVDPDRPARAVRSYGSAHFQPWMLRFAHLPPHPGFYARRSACQQVGAFDDALRIGGDFDWLVRFFLKHRLTAAAIDESLVAMRQGGASQRGMGSMVTFNREAAASLRRHGFATPRPLLTLKYAVKWLQLVQRPRSFPAPETVRLNAA